MATIALRVEDDVRDQLIALAELHDLTLSDLIRESIDQLLGRDVPKRRGVVPASLTAYPPSFLGRRTAVSCPRFTMMLPWRSSTMPYSSGLPPKPTT